MLAIYTSSNTYQFTYSGQVLKFAFDPLPQGWRDAFAISPGDNLAGTVLPWTWSIPQSNCIYDAGATEQAFVTSKGTTQNSMFSVSSDWETSVDGTWQIQGQDWYHAAFSVTQN